MTFTYNTPPVLPRDEVRFRSGDITEKPWSVDDATIDWLLGPEQHDGNVWQVAADVAEKIGDYYAGRPGGQKTVGPLSLARDQAGDASRWYDRARRLRAGGSGGSVASPVYERGRRSFAIGMHDNGSFRHGEPERGR
jgi:hypothetical protein